MGRAFICLGALTAALLAAAPEARAKMVYYEINGQRYSYSTNNRAQVKEARQRIDAASRRGGESEGPGGAVGQSARRGVRIEGAERRQGG